VALPDVLMRAATDSTNSLDGRLITITRLNDAQRRQNRPLARVVIICCAGDAQPARIRLSGPAVTVFPKDTWLRVEGQVLPGTVTSVKGIEKPANY
jgi:uncharacterized membrane protein YcgQ (UPF0703/DUF1980 family)